jgi:hypothetical protein
MSNRLFQCLYKRQGVRQIFALNQGGGRVGAAFMLPGCRLARLSRGQHKGTYSNQLEGGLPKRKKERTIFFTKLFGREKGDLPMPYDTPGQRNVPALENGIAVLETMMVQAVESADETAVVKKAGRPNRLSNRLLAAGILWCVLHG